MPPQVGKKLVFPDSTSMKVKLISYFSVNGGKPGLPTLVQETTHKSIHLYLSYRIPPFPALCTRLNKDLLLLIIELIIQFLKKRKKGPHPKDEEPVVPPLLAQKSSLYGIH